MILHHMTRRRLAARALLHAAGAPDDERPSFGLELLFPGHFLQHLVQLRMLGELDHVSARGADEVVVGGVAVVVVEDGAVADFECAAAGRRRRAT